MLRIISGFHGKEIEVIKEENERLMQLKRVSIWEGMINANPYNEELKEIAAECVTLHAK